MKYQKNKSILISNILLILFCVYFQGCEKKYNEYVVAINNITSFQKEINMATLDLRLNTHFAYYTGEIDRWGAWAMADISPFHELIRLRPQHSSMNVWIGMPGVRAHPHYDGYHNFYVQLKGRKKFALYPPMLHDVILPYSFLSGFHAQSQLDVGKMISHPGKIECILEPGDLLYIPPLWFHETEAMGESISVNAWT